MVCGSLILDFSRPGSGRERTRRRWRVSGGPIDYRRSSNTRSTWSASRRWSIDHQLLEWNALNGRTPPAGAILTRVERGRREGASPSAAESGDTDIPQISLHLPNGLITILWGSQWL